MLLHAVYTLNLNIEYKLQVVFGNLNEKNYNYANYIY